MKASRVKDESGGRRFLTEEAAVVAHSGFYFPLLELSLFNTPPPPSFSSTSSFKNCFYAMGRGHISRQNEAKVWGLDFLLRN